MAEICLRQRAESARRSWGLGAERTLNLVIVADEIDPGTTEIVELLDAVRRYAPPAAIWQYGGHALTLIDAGSPVDASPAARRGDDARHALRIALHPPARAPSPRGAADLRFSGSPEDLPVPVGARRAPEPDSRASTTMVPMRVRMRIRPRPHGSPPRRS